ncbi:MAG: aminopeptidase, partial [Candidatus Eisenbacteria sp.]|nr:aminopeptidase [Candidatus Eisenbacteria bacterium]
MTQVRFTVFLTLAAVLVIAPDAPADGTGGISPEFARKLQETRLTPAEQAIADIVANGSIKDVALNRAKYISHDGIINHRIKSGDVTNQKGSGRCWMFAGFNTLRPQVIKRFGLKSFEFSECYLQFWDKLEKANKFLQEMIDYADQPLDDRRVEIIIDSPLGDGGWWTYFVDLVQKYGVVPKETMPETYNSSATGTMNHL